MTLREDQPVNMAGAFEKPVSKSNDGYEAKSIQVFLEYIQKVYDNYVDEPARSWIVCLDDISINAERVKFKELAEVVKEAIQKFD